MTTLWDDGATSWDDDDTNWDDLRITPLALDQGGKAITPFPGMRRNPRKTRLGVFGLSSSVASVGYGGRTVTNPDVAHTGGPYTRLNVNGMSRVQLGTFTHSSVAAVIVDIPLASMSWTAKAPRAVVRDVILEVGGKELTPGTYAPTIIQGPPALGVPTAAMSWTALTPSVSQTGVLDMEIDVPLASMSWQPLTPMVGFVRVIDVPTASIVWVAQPLSVSIESAGSLTLTQADINAIAARMMTVEIEPGVNFIKLLRALGAEAVGETSGTPAVAGVMGFKAIGNPGTQRVEGDTDGKGTRDAVVLTLGS